VEYNNVQILVGSYTPDRIINIDETNIYFNQTSNVTLEESGTRSVGVKPSGSMNRCTVLLGCTMGGKMLQPFVVFVGKKSGRLPCKWTGQTDFPTSCVYTVQEKGWIDKDTFLEWIEKVCQWQDLKVPSDG
jgi:hypothetical protein